MQTRLVATKVAEMIRRFINSKTIWVFVKKVPWKLILISGPWILVFLVLAFYNFENKRGARAWKQAQLAAKEAGVSFCFKGNLPGVSESSLDTSTLILDGTTVHSFEKRCYRGDVGFNSHQPLFLENRGLTQPADIRLWLDPAGGPYSPQEAAAKLRRLAQVDLDLLRQLVEETKGNQLTELTNFTPDTALSASQVIADDTSLAIIEGNFRQIADNLEFLLKLINNKNDSHLLGYLYKKLIVPIFENTLWNTIMSGALTDTQLHSLENQLSYTSIENQIPSIITGELSYIMDFFREHQNDKAEYAQVLITQYGFQHFSKIRSNWTPLDDACEKIDLFLLNQIPFGWLELYKATTVQEILRMQKKAKTGGFLKLENHSPSQFSHPFLKALSVEQTPLLIKNGILSGRRAEAKLRLARIGILLALHKRKHGRYPSALSDLKSENPLVNIDPFNGLELGYRLKADGTPSVWSVGDNQIDEGGLPLRRKNDEGDIVWQITPIAGLTETEWRRKLRKHSQN